jgi:hypothetical protein
VGACAETFPLQCRSQLVDLTTDDLCEAMVTLNISIPLSEAGLLHSMYSGASLSIKGSEGRSVGITLPEM